MSLSGGAGYRSNSLSDAEGKKSFLNLVCLIYFNKFFLFSISFNNLSSNHIFPTCITPSIPYSYLFLSSKSFLLSPTPTLPLPSYNQSPFTRIHSLLHPLVPLSTTGSFNLTPHPSPFRVLAIISCAP